MFPLAIVVRAENPLRFNTFLIFSEARISESPLNLKNFSLFSRSYFNPII